MVEWVPLKVIRVNETTQLRLKCCGGLQLCAGKGKGNGAGPPGCSQGGVN